MRKIRKGKDITIRWAILTQGEPLPLEGRDLLLELRERYQRTEIPFAVDGNVITAVWHGTDCASLGIS